MRQLVYALQTESENAKLIFPKSISEALLSPEPWSLSFPKTMKEGEINNTRKGTSWIKWSVKSDIYALQWNQCPNSGPGFQVRAHRFSIETLLALPSFCFFVFLKECHGMSQVDLTFIISLPLHKCRNDWYRVLHPTSTIVFNHSPESKLSSNSCDSYSIGWNTPDIKNVRSQYAVPTSGKQNPQYGFLFSILRSDTAVELHLNIDAYETPSFRLPHALSLALQRHFKRVICPTC